MSTTTTGHVHLGSGHEFDEMSRLVREHFAEVSARHMPHLFTTSADPDALWEAYLTSWPVHERQHHNCNACRRFIQTYGGLVFIDDKTGLTTPAMWPEGSKPASYSDAVESLREIVSGARVTGVFLTQEKRWGTPVTGVWHHYGFEPGQEFVFRHRLDEPHQVAAKVLERNRVLVDSLREFPESVVDEALVLLEADALYRGEKVIGPAHWFKSLHSLRASVGSARQRDNLTWLATVTAPKGFTNVRSNTIGTLLEDIAAKMPLDSIKRRFAAKLRPDLHNRPQTAPGAGNIKRGEEIIEKLGLADSLRRRHATFEEVADRAIWLPKPARRPTGGVFGHLTPREQEASSLVSLPLTNITWVKFRDKVLPTTEKIEFMATNRNDFYFGLVGPVVYDSAPILRWDREGERNPYSWYVYTDGSLPTHWGMEPGWHSVKGILTQPTHWGSRVVTDEGEAALFVLDDALDQREPGLCLFPSILSGDLQEIRKTIEAHSSSMRLEGRENANCAGVRLSSKNPINHGVRVTTGKSIAQYLIDRWD